MTFFQNPGRLLALIVACLLLLGVSQVLWINRVWNEQKDILGRETNYVFQQTVMALQDSLVSRSMTRDGVPMKRRMPVGEELFTRRTWQTFPPPVLTETKIQLTRKMSEATPELEGAGTNQIQVIVASSDSQPVTFQRGLGRFFLNIRQDSMSRSSPDIVFEIQTDTISPEELRRSYGAALASAALPDSFNLLSAEDPGGFPKTTSIVTEPALAGIMRHHFFQAEIHDYQGYLLRKIVPYTLFSLFLLCLTSLSFRLIFNNLKQQQKLSRQKTAFISNMTHELKTPLTTVGVALEALNDFEVLRNPEKTKEYLQISKLELDRLNLLVDKVLRLSMFEEQALQLRPELLDLVATTRQVIDAMTLQANGVGAQIRFVTDQQPCLVSCDRLHLTGIIYNLLDNALKYRRESPEITVSVEKTVRDAKEFAVLKVSDNGIGIAPEFQQQIFEKFFRVPAGDTHNVKGHGLGLSYVAHVAREHGGHIRVESRPGAGSTFTVEIPVATPPPTA